MLISLKMILKYAHCKVAGLKLLRGVGARKDDRRYIPDFVALTINGSFPTKKPRGQRQQGPGIPLSLPELLIVPIYCIVY